MKKKPIKKVNWCKNWTIDGLISFCVSQGMGFMVFKVTSEELKESKKIIENEIKRRIKNKSL